MHLPPGTCLGPYEVIGPLGAGGMGEVYKARDTRLGRAVAIKVLTGKSSTDPNSRARLVREAQIIAALSHPNICAIHDVGDHEGMSFLVLEYLDGETLAARIARGQPLPLDDTIRIATQIAEALAAAHRAGVVHRDLKPGNVMLTKTGVKVLDFGLAKLASAETAETMVTTVAAASMTATNAVVGTWPYMSPEQIDGRASDARSDLFAFGAIVYEMATGRRAFQGESLSRLIVAILEVTPPPISALQPQTPAALERLVMKCLAKNPDARWQSASDVADELRWQLTGSGLVPGVSTPGRHGIGWLAAMMVAVTLAGAGLWLLTRSNEAGSAAPVEPIQQRVTYTGEVNLATLSPDGQWMAYVTGRPGEYRLLVRDLATRQELEVWKGTAVSDLKWLPDGAQIALVGVKPPDHGLFLLSRLGGAARRLGVSGGYIAVSPDGSRTATADQDAAHGIDVAPLGGGMTRRLNLSAVQWLYGLDWSRANRLLIPGVSVDGTTGVLTGSPDADEKRWAFKNRAHGFLSACGSPASDAFYVFTEERLERVRLDRGLAQTPEVLMTGLPPPPAQLPMRMCSVSADGQRLLHLRHQIHSNLWWLDLTRAQPSALALTKGTAAYEHPQISNDGQWVIYSSGLQGEIVKARLDGGEQIPLTRGWSPRWSPGGRRLAFLSDRGGPVALWLADAEGRKASEVHGAQLSVNHSWTWLSDDHIAWQTPDARNFQIRDLQTGSQELLVNNPSVGWVFVPRMSPRGDRVALYWNRQPRGLWLLTWPARAERLLAAELVPDGWSADGAWIYAHRMGTRTIVRVSVATGAIERLGEFPNGYITRFDCDVGRNGTAIICRIEDAVADAWLIQNFDPDAVGARPAR